MHNPAAKSSEVLAKDITDTDIQAAREMLASMIHSWSPHSAADYPHVTPLSVLAKRFIIRNLEEPVHPDPEDSPSDETAEVIAFAAQIAQTMAFEQDTTDREAANLAALVLQLSEKTSLESPVVLLDASGENAAAASRSATVALKTVGILSSQSAFDPHAHFPEPYTDQPIVSPTGRQGRSARSQLVADGSMLGLNEFPAGEDGPLEFQLVLYPGQNPSR